VTVGYAEILRLSAGALDAHRLSRPRLPKDQAFAWLNRAYGQKDAGLYMIESDAILKNPRGNPRYKAFLHTMNLTE
jgi:hypothetical protein